ncbi:hypothetical protein QFC20_006693 [Naganishia adeliensis]|uniref:Uncharacterized protein n=1 Tax=Naganishia adeliensis TaxID=92952 RepID=A0ACC2V9A3_9TREE|nr:hypothetical protein QFC20_006693 [Naganishia adeliensis]
MNKIKRLLSSNQLPPPRLTAQLHLPNDVVVVHPRSTNGPANPDDAAFSQDDTLLSGHAVIIAQPYLTLYTIRVGLVVVFRYQLPEDTQTHETVIFERYKSFDQEEIQYTSVSRQSAQKHLIHRKVDFDILVPASLPTYEHSPYGIILAQVRLEIDFGYAGTSGGLLSKEALDYIRANPPVQLQDEEEKAPTVLGRAMILDLWQGNGKVTFPDRKSSWMLRNRVQQSWVKTIAVIANPNPTGGINPLRISKSGFAPGLGEWRLFMLSDAISHSAPGLIIHAIHIHVNQTFSLISPDEYQFSTSGYDELASETRCPTEKLVVFMDGKVPAKGVKRRTASALWVGSTSEGDMVKEDAEMFIWQQDKLRLPDETKLRPTSLSGTSTPLRAQHEITVKTFFSVQGETLRGERMDDKNDEGDVRMLVMAVPAVLASCCCIEQRVKLPSYSEDPSALEESAPMCACCKSTEEFPTPTFPREFLVSTRRVEEETTMRNGSTGPNTANKSRAATSGPSYS